jgi:hypothetical protein
MAMKVFNSLKLKVHQASGADWYELPGLWCRLVWFSRLLKLMGMKCSGHMKLMGMNCQVSEADGFEVRKASEADGYEVL